MREIFIWPIDSAQLKSYSCTSREINIKQRYSSPVFPSVQMGFEPMKPLSATTDTVCYASYLTVGAWRITLPMSMLVAEFIYAVVLSCSPASQLSREP